MASVAVSLEVWRKLPFKEVKREGEWEGGLAESIADVYKMAKSQYLSDNKQPDSQHLRSITGLTFDAAWFDVTHQALRWKTAGWEGAGRP